MQADTAADAHADAVDTTAERPLFMIGCVRSGTTFVRDLIKRHEHVLCPEETHYYRWGEPFRTRGFDRPALNGPVLKAHRNKDGITEERFRQLYAGSQTRGELLVRHIREMARLRNLTDYRWFDKTPQNVYGLSLIENEFPRAVYLHMVRNPLNVVASLKLGKVVKVEDIHGACNYWLEAVTCVRHFKRLNGEHVLEVHYEDLVEDVQGSLAGIFRLFDLPFDRSAYSASDARPERNLYRSVLDADEIETVRRRCGALAESYGYAL